MSEVEMMRKIQVAVSRMGARVFRNNNGMAWRPGGGGELFRFTKPGHINVMPGDIVINKPVPIHFGLVEGAADLIGWHPYKVRESDVGKLLAVFTAIEVKSPTGKAKEEQINFLKQVELAGGNQTIARTENEALLCLYR